MAAALSRCIHCTPPRPNAGGVFRRIFSSSVDSLGRRCLRSFSAPFPLGKGMLNVHVLHREVQTISSWKIRMETRYDASTSTMILMMKDLVPYSHGHLDTCKEDMMFKLPKALFFVNIWILTLPLEVLAETCEADKAFLKMPLLFAIAVVGATIGGLLARRRKDELKRLNDQLRQINEALRRQAKIESYAPSLSYAPLGRIKETEVIVDPKKQQLLSTLRTGKNLLRNQDHKKAVALFKEAFELAQSLEDPLEEKKAARGLGASLQRQGKYREAIKYHSKVPEISKRSGEDSGIAEAYGAIADCYTELSDLEGAAKFYDKYIARLESD